MAVGNQTGESSLGTRINDSENRVNKNVTTVRPNSICNVRCREAGRRGIKLVSFFITTVFRRQPLSGHAEMSADYATTLALFIRSVTLIDNNRQLVTSVILISSMSCAAETDARTFHLLSSPIDAFDWYRCDEIPIIAAFGADTRVYSDRFLLNNIVYSCRPSYHPG